jgi:transposase
LAHIAPLLAEAAGDPAVPELARELFTALAREWDRLGVELKAAEAKLMAWHKADETSRRLAQIPSLGPIGASMLVMKVPDPKAFKSARHFAAWIGLTPKDHSTAGKQRLGAITKAGDEALRSVLVVGATAVLKPIAKGGGLRSPWLVKLLASHEPKPAAVALANKVARIAWKMMVTGQAYDPKLLMRELPAT